MPEDPAGEIRGNRSFPRWVRGMDPLLELLRLASYNTSQDVASNSRSLVQVAEQPHRISLLQRCSLSIWMSGYRSNYVHEIVVFARDAPHKQPHVTQESHGGGAGKLRTPWAGRGRRINRWTP